MRHFTAMCPLNIKRSFAILVSLLHLFKKNIFITCSALHISTVFSVYLSVLFSVHNEVTQVQTQGQKDIWELRATDIATSSKVSNITNSHTNLNLMLIYEWTVRTEVTNTHTQKKLVWICNMTRWFAICLSKLWIYVYVKNSFDIYV